MSRISLVVTWEESPNVARLWTDMYAAGVSGPWFDMMRVLYARMSFAVKYGDDHSLPFRSLIGLWTGDSVSPMLWNIYFADFRLPPHKDDVHLNGRPVCQAEQADDNLVMSTAFRPFQAKVGMFGKWGGNKRTYVSARKSKWMIFGPLPSVIPTLLIGDHYVGIWFTSIHKNIFSRHYTIKAVQSEEHQQRYLRPQAQNWVLAWCATLTLDADCTLLDELVEVQHLFLRRLLGLNPHSMLAVLFTETGQMPIRIRRLLLALGRLQYLLELDDRRVVRSALLDSIALFREGKSGWATDLAIGLRRLPTAIVVTPDDLLCSKTIEDIAKRIVGIVDDDLQRDIDRLVKTHLLRNRVERGEDKTSRLVTRRLRHYLVEVAVPAHRKAITGLLLGDHNLSVERLRYPSRDRLPVQGFTKVAFRQAALKIDVLIVGGGIAGLACAYTLGRIGHRVRVLERTDGSQRGAGVRMPPQYDEGARGVGPGGRAQEVPGVSEDDLHAGGERDKKTCCRKQKDGFYSFQCVDLQVVLFAAYMGIMIISNAPVTGVEETTPTPSVHLADGTALTADLIIGADGGKSVLREFVMERKMLGQTADIHSTRDAPEGWGVSCPPSTVDLSAYDERCRAKYVSRDHVEDSVDRSGRVLLVGDAAHPTIAHSTQGPSMSFEDAEALGMLMARLARAEKTPQLTEGVRELRQARCAFSNK
ncbi:hypothetical protein B0H14DRAFT_3902606 [Mycena olivaceomarginata]|nr:hypothetical protein B0H14DRAFT_3902606 [Mycena olivaceomarginata]